MSIIEYVEPHWRDLDMRSLQVDQAYLVIHSYYGQVSHFYLLSDACYSCPYERIKKISANSLDKFNYKVDVTHPLNIKLFDQDFGQYAPSNVSALCTEYTANALQEFGVYNLTLNANGSCDFKVDKVGVNVNYSLLITISVLIIIFGMINKYGGCKSSPREPEPALVADESNTPVARNQRRRIHSLDTFRGLAIVLMIFVNSGAGKYWWLEHAVWSGLHLADIVFPAFLWIMGACIPITVRTEINAGQSKRAICMRVISRSIKLFLLGLCLNSLNGPTFAQLRIMGVLQRFGIAYLFCGILYTFTVTNTLFVPQNRWHKITQDLIVFKIELIVALLLIIIHLMFAFGLPVAGCPRGYFGPGGKHANAAYMNCTGGVTGYIDRLLLGDSHLYQHTTAKSVYATRLAFDPEGLFGCLLTIVQVILGMLTGSMLHTAHEAYARVKRWFCYSLILLIAGGILSNFNAENGLIPINKNLWSITFVFVTTAIAFALFALIYLIEDILYIWNGFPFSKCGKNAIALYVGHTILHKSLPWHWRLEHMNTHFLLLLESIWNTVLWIYIALFMDKHNIYIKL